MIVFMFLYVRAQNIRNKFLPVTDRLNFPSSLLWCDVFGMMCAITVVVLLCDTCSALIGDYF
jgi:hypothetical protein